MTLLALFFLSLTKTVLTATVLPRWGQASLLINDDTLYVHGGKIDEFNGFSYTSAPSTSDLLYLPLSEAFDLDNPPWEVVSVSSNISTPGPAVAWHSLSAYSTTKSLLFGGAISNTGQPVLPTQPDSSWLLQFLNAISPVWTSEESGWAFQPIRRIHHASVSTPDGSVIIFCGQTSDGSGLDGGAFSDSYIYSPSNDGVFTIIDSQNGPPGLFGHTAVILSDQGKVLIFGGVAPSLGGLVPLSTIWVYDINSSSFTELSVSNSSLPAPRRAFASVWLGNGKILIHGGSDATLQTTYNDGWLLDTSTSPATWTRIEPLDQLGPRRDHFAVSVGSQVIFCFGYTGTSAASNTMQIYDPSTGEFPTGFIPASSQSSSTASPTGSGAITIGHTSAVSTIPGMTVAPATSSAETGSGIQPTHTSTDVPSPTNTAMPDTIKHTTLIAVSTALSILALLAAGVATAVYMRKKRRERERIGLFTSLNDDDREDGLGTPLGNQNPQVQFGRRPSKPFGTVFGAIGLGTAGRLKSPGERRDMLADEDTRRFGWEGYGSQNQSSWSLKSVLATASRRMRSRDASYGSTGSAPGTPWREKSDPFSDGAALMRDEESGFVGAAVREPSAENDPFADPEYSRPSIHPVLPPIRTMASSSLFAPSAAHVATLSPLTENSHSTLGSSPANTFSKASSSQSSSSLTHSNMSHPYDSATSRTSTSLQDNRASSPRITSMIDANAAPMIRRSDTWWSRFSRSSFLDRRNSDSARHDLEIRDPQPHPGRIQLGPIEEKASPPDSGPSRQNTSSRKARRGEGSLSSHHTARTANSEMLERVGLGEMDIVMRTRTRTGSGSVDQGLDRSPSVSTRRTTGSGDFVLEGEMVASPTAERPSNSVPSSVDERPRPTSTNSSGSSAVAERVRAYERRLTTEEQVPLSPSTKSSRSQEQVPQRKSQHAYSLVPRASLYVANPDGQRQAGSADS